MNEQDQTAEGTQRRTKFYALCGLCLFSLWGCGENTSDSIDVDVANAEIYSQGSVDDVLDFRNADVVNGRIYPRDGDTPFSGHVTNIPLESLLEEGGGLHTYLTTSSSTFGFLNGAKNQLESLLDRTFYNPEAICGVTVRSGVLSGPTACADPRSSITRLEIPYSDGLIHGTVTVYQETGEFVIGRALFEHGNLNGSAALFSPSTGIQLVEFPYVNNELHGTAFSYYEDSGNLKRTLPYEDGLLHGEVIHYAADGAQITYRGTYRNGRPTGLGEDFFPSGRRSAAVYTQDGGRHGHFRQWDENGTLITNEIYARNALLWSSDQSVPSGYNCVSKLAAKFMEENQTDQMVTDTQVDEWQQRCASQPYSP